MVQRTHQEVPRCIEDRARETTTVMMGVDPPAIDRSHRGEKGLHDIVETHQPEISTVRDIQGTRVVIGRGTAKEGHQAKVNENGAKDAIVRLMQVNIVTFTDTAPEVHHVRRVD